MKRFEDTLPLKDYDNNPTLWFENEADFNTLWNSLPRNHHHRLEYILVFSNAMAERLDKLKAEIAYLSRAREVVPSPL